MTARRPLAEAGAAFEDAHEREGLKVLIWQTPPGIALIDAGLPMLNGIELAAEVKRRASKRPAWTMLIS